MATPPKLLCGVDRTAGPSIAFFMLCSSSMLLVNKVAVHLLPLPSLVACVQFAVTALFCLVLKACGVPVDGFEWSKLKPYLLYSMLFAATIYCNMRALSQSNVETIIVFRASCPMFVALLEWLVLDRMLPGVRSVLALAFLFTGACGYVLTDGAFALSGWRAYTWVSAYSCLISIELVFCKYLVGPHLGFVSMWGNTLYANALSIVPMLAFGLAAGEHERVAAVAWSVEISAALAASCVVGILISYSGWRVVSVVSATCMMVLGIVNKLLTVLINVAIWDKHASPLGLMFLLMCILAAATYRQAPEHKDGERSTLSARVSSIALVLGVVLAIVAMGQPGARSSVEQRPAARAPASQRPAAPTPAARSPGARDPLSDANVRHGKSVIRAACAPSGNPAIVQGGRHQTKSNGRRGHSSLLFSTGETYKLSSAVTMLCCNWNTAHKPPSWWRRNLNVSGPAESLLISLSKMSSCSWLLDDPSVRVIIFLEPPPPDSPFAPGLTVSNLSLLPSKLHQKTSIVDVAKYFEKPDPSSWGGLALNQRDGDLFNRSLGSTPKQNQSRIGTPNYTTSNSFGIGYSLSNEFWSARIWELPEVHKLEYLMRIDEDSRIVCGGREEPGPFATMRDGRFLYGYYYFQYDKWFSHGFAKTFTDYLCSTGGRTAWPLELDRQLGPERSVLPTFYNDLEIMHVPHFRSMAVRQLTDEIVATKGFYTHRWSDGSARFTQVAAHILPRSATPPHSPHIKVIAHTDGASVRASG